MYIYHAHGYVVRNDFVNDGNEQWTRDSSFCAVFNDFGKAKRFLLEKFNSLLLQIYKRETFLCGEGSDNSLILDDHSPWRQEYIDEYIDYQLIITLFDTDQRWSNSVSTPSLDAPQEIDWHFDSRGGVLTRYFKYLDGMLECEYRPTDDLPAAGSQFNKGDLVLYTGYRSIGVNYIYIVYDTPHKPEDTTSIWQNHYKLLYLEDSLLGHDAAKVHKEQLHEQDLYACLNEVLNTYDLKEPILLLQKIVRGEAKISEQLWQDILDGKVIFNVRKSWREIPELCNIVEKK